MTPTTTHWVHDLSPFIYQFSENLGIRYYGVAYLAGFVVAYLLLLRCSHRKLTRLTGDGIADLMVALIIGVLVGGRLGYFLLYTPGLLFTEPLAILRVWDGGMASHGGFVGVTIAVLWFAHRNNLRWLHLGDLIVCVAPAGLLFGRIANFINGELWGKVSQVPWAVIFPASAPGMPPEYIAPRHPVQLYSAALEGALLLGLMQILLWRTNLLQKTPGRLTGIFLCSYAIVRSIDEIFREPDAALIAGLSRGTFYSIFVLIAGIVLIVRKSRPLEVVTVPTAP